MDRSKRTAKTGAAAALGRVRQAVTDVAPLASSARATARRGVHRTRALTAPQLERAGEALEKTVAPKVSAMLSSAAQRLEPAKPRRPRWLKLAVISLLTAAASAVAAVVRNRAQPDRAAPAETDTQSGAPAASTAPATKVDGAKAATSADAHVDGQIRAS
jgi:hypothetical protein